MSSNIQSSLNPSSFNETSFKRNSWHATVPAGTSFDTLTDPSYWAHVAARGIKPFDMLEVQEESGAYWAQFIVKSVAKTHLNLVMVQRVDLVKVEAKQKVSSSSSDDNYEVKHRGPRKWSVVRKHDNTVMIEGLETREQGDEWLASHLVLMANKAA